MGEILKLRMYSLVMYNLSGIQKGIQAYHASIRYALKHFNDADFQQWANIDQTVYILSGGGSDEMILNCEELKLLDIKFVQFNEPDLNQSLSAVSFLLDERVWDKTKYPDFKKWMEINNPNTKSDKRLIELWVKSIGGEEIRKKREFISQFRFA